MADDKDNTGYVLASPFSQGDTVTYKNKNGEEKSGIITKFFEDNTFEINNGDTIHENQIIVSEDTEPEDTYTEVKFMNDLKLYLQNPTQELLKKIKKYCKEHNKKGVYEIRVNDGTKYYLVVPLETEYNFIYYFKKKEGIIKRIDEFNRIYSTLFKHTHDKLDVDNFLLFLNNIQSENSSINRVIINNIENSKIYVPTPVEGGSNKYRRRKTLKKRKRKTLKKKKRKTLKRKTIKIYRSKPTY